MQSNAKQCKAMQSNAKQTNSKQCKCKTINEKKIPNWGHAIRGLTLEGTPNPFGKSFFLRPLRVGLIGTPPAPSPLPQQAFPSSVPHGFYTGNPLLPVQEPLQGFCFSFQGQGVTPACQPHFSFFYSFLRKTEPPGFKFLAERIFPSRSVP